MRVSTIVTALGMLAFAPAALADADSAIKARKGTMQVYGHYLGELGAMAKGAVEFDAAAAQNLAVALNAIATIDQTTFWPQGSDSASMPGKTRAKPEIWSTFPAVVEKNKDFETAVKTLLASTGDIESLQAAMGGVGKGCKGCHEDFRGPRN